jgi:cyclophilin family peptidyl-prolyl cis-trans isomerase/protein-disulfide isomerase
MSFKKLFLFILLMAFGLGACAPKQQATPEALPTTESTADLSQTTVDLGGLIPTADLPLYDENNRMLCKVVPGFLSKESEPQTRVYDLIGKPSDTDLSIGPENAKLTVIKYSDFQCPYCASAYENLELLLETYPEDVRLIFRHFPLSSIHDKAKLAAQAADAANLQGKFKEMYAILFEEQQAWSSLSVEDFTSWLILKAEEIDLDINSFKDDLESEAVVSIVSDSYDKAVSLGLQGTPTMFVNGNYMGNLDFYTLSALLKVFDFESSMYEECPPWLIDTEKTYTATIKTEKGDIEIKLYPDKAPLAVNSFVFLAREGYFDGITFHRVIDEFMAQSGDPTGTGFANPGYQFRNEIVSGLEFDSAGLLAMANSGADTNGSQFFITYGAAADLNGSYTIFGEVLEGMDVLESLVRRNVQENPAAPEGDKIISITIKEK